MSKHDQRLTNIFKHQTKRICSLEFSSKKEINYEALEDLKMSFCSVIWIGNYDKPPDEIEPLIAAGELIKRGYPTVLHFAARNNNKKSVVKNLEYAKQIGVRNLLVMRGASPECQMEVKKYDFPYTVDLIKFIKNKYGDYFDLCVPGYPYKHPESKDLAEDMKYLKTKVFRTMQVLNS
ncbi:hypothetical protein HHI36_005999 [Cryptolaemus montrouzieri]|uniref:Methylenetetrahydrofolate reductase (NAD(P)H) n=1 Tax=Cryptolaemus montrouzieri TaxID=559131 RepID=A0ABD2NVQ9_9CUCU